MSAASIWARRDAECRGLSPEAIEARGLVPPEAGTAEVTMCRRCGGALEDLRTLRELAREALQVQDACNLSGVVLSYGKAMSRLRALHDHWGTERLNTHPIAQLWADKCASLAGCQGQIGAPWAVEAYRQVRALAAGQVEP